MARCHKNDVGSLVLNRATAAAGHHHHHFKLWTSFSSATFRRRLFDAIACGGNSFSRQIDTELQPVNGGEKLPEQNKQRSNPKRTGSDKLSDLLKLTEKDDAKCSVSEESEAAISRKIEALEELKKVVKMLQCEEEEREKGKKVKEAARNVRSLTKENADARTTIAMLGAIPPLVGMIEESCSFDCLIDSLYALLNLGIGNDLNKAAIVKAGAVHKMLKLIESPNGSLDPTIADAIVANFLGLSALDSNKTIIGSSGAIPFLVKILKNLDNTSSSQAKQDSLRALYNLSLLHLNVPFVLETDLIPFLMNTLGDMEVSERILSILSNVVSTPEGRKAISMVPDAFPILVDVLNWTDSPGCQEKASYIIMVMAHKAYGDRQAMIEAGVVSALLELTLLGSTLAQKRASRILECLRIDKGKQVSESYGGGSGPNLSAPICGSSSSTTGLNQDPKECVEEMEDMMSEEKKAVKQLVQQSLQNNMRRIVKRANLPQDFVPSDHYKSLTSSSTSKSLPF